MPKMEHKISFSANFCKLRKLVFIFATLEPYFKASLRFAVLCKKQNGNQKAQINALLKAIKSPVY